jgi:hypothetical protein
MKKLLIPFFSIVLLASFTTIKTDESKEKEQINAMLNNWHLAAAEANFNNYFNALTESSIFIGTDATENWNKTEFQAFAKPYFDKGKAWNFKALERHIYFSKDKKTAWFDELLDTQMKLCRGSGVLVKVDNKWKIQHYVLSMTIPNDTSDEVVKIKAPIEDALIAKFKK